MPKPPLPDKVKAVVIGSSAGGVLALKRLLGALPQNFPAPILIVQHIASGPSHSLASVLDHVCALNVKEAQECEALQAGTVYLAPPNYHLLVEMNATLSFSIDAPVAFARPSIDVLFESAAETFGPQLIAVILTGANHDGSQGMKRIKAKGGITIVQDPADAESSRMPQAALDAVVPDHVLPLDRMAALLQQLVGRPKLAPTLVAARTTLPPEGALDVLGRPSGA